MVRTFIRSLLSRLYRKLKDKDLLSVLALRDEGAFAEAYDVLNHIQEEHPRVSENGDVQVLRAELELVANDDFSKCREALGKAKELGCRDWGSYYRVHGCLMWRQGDAEKAAQDYRQSVAFSPHVPTLTLLAQALAALQDKDVVAVCREILEKDPGNCHGHIYRAWHAAQSGDADEAMRRADKARESVHSADDCFELSRLYYELNSFENALTMGLEADRLGLRGKSLLYACVAACYLSLGETRSAWRYIELAASFDPDDEYLKEVRQAYESKIRETGGN